MNNCELCDYSNRLIEKLKSLDTLNTLDLALVKKAIHWAKKYHNGQFRKSGEPFYTHPLEVAYMVSNYNLKTDVIIASILHDIIEDTEVTVEMIQDDFGWRIAEMVDRLTRDKPGGIKLSVEEVLNNAYYLKDMEVLLIKLFDRLHNMQTIGTKSEETRKKITEETFKRFISLSMYLGKKISGMLEIEEYIDKLCSENLPSRQPFVPNEMILTGSFQSVFPDFQNDLSLKHMQHLLES